MDRVWDIINSRQHVEEIRRRKGADSPEGLESDNIRDLDRALNL